MDLMNILAERVLYDPEFRKPLPRQDGSVPAKFALTQRASLLGGRIAEVCRDPKVMEVLAQFVANYRFSRGGFDMLAARGIAAPASVSPDEGGAMRVVAAGAKPVRRGAEWVVKGAGGTVALSASEAEAATWLLARPDVTAPELLAAHPGIDASALLARLGAAGLLVSAA